MNNSGSPTHGSLSGATRLCVCVCRGNTLFSVNIGWLWFIKYPVIQRAIREDRFLVIRMRAFGFVCLTARWQLTYIFPISMRLKRKVQVIQGRALCVCCTGNPLEKCFSLARFVGGFVKSSPAPLLPLCLLFPPGLKQNTHRRKRGKTESESVTLTSDYRADPKRLCEGFARALCCWRLCEGRIRKQGGGNQQKNGN